MSETETSSVPPAPVGPQSVKIGRDRASGWRRAVLMSATLGAGIALGAGGLAVAAGAPGAIGWHHGFRLERIQHVVSRALDAVGATTAQEAKVHDIIAINFADMGGRPEDREALRKQALDLLRAPVVDRPAVEKLRAQQVAKFDERSKQMVGAVLDAADQLTPDQRAKLADLVGDMAQRGPMGRWGGPGGGRGMERPDRGGGDRPGRGPDDGSDKD